MIKTFKEPPWEGFSNFARLQHPIVKGPDKFWTVENAFVAAKTHNMDHKHDIALMTPGEAKRFGKTLIFLRLDWDDVKVEVMRELLKEKFSQPLFRTLLQMTNDEEIQEGNWWHDMFWGQCLCDKHKNEIGQNMLGKLLMEIR